MRGEKLARKGLNKHLLASKLGIPETEAVRIIRAAKTGGGR
jgi:hypothetical protein